MSRAAVLKESAPRRSLHERHRPEKTLLYRIIDRHYPEFLTYMAEQGKPLPNQLRLLFASRPELMGKVLGIVYRAIAMYLIKKAGLTGRQHKAVR